MKRIDAFIPSIKRNSVVDAIMKTGVGGVTIAEARGKGSGARPLVRGPRATARYVAEYSRTDCVTILADESEVGKIINAIMNSAYTGKPGDGKIFVSSIEETYDIATKSKGSL